MKKWRVCVTETDCYETVVEAESEEDAREKVNNLLCDHGLEAIGGKLVYGDVEVSDVWEEEE